VASNDKGVTTRNNGGFDPRAFRDVVAQTREAAATATIRAAELQPKEEPATVAETTTQRRRRSARPRRAPRRSVPFLSRLEDDRVYRLSRTLLTAALVLTLGIGYGGSIGSLVRQLILPSDTTTARGGRGPAPDGEGGDLQGSLIDESNTGRPQTGSGTDPGATGSGEAGQIWASQGRLPATDEPSAPGALVEGPSRLDWGDPYQHYVVAAPSVTGVDTAAPTTKPPSTPAAAVPGPAAAPPGGPLLERPAPTTVLDAPTADVLEPGSTQVVRSDGSVETVSVPAGALSLGIPTPAERTMMSSYQDTLASRVIIVDRNGLVGPANRRYLHTVNGLVDTGVVDDGSTQPGASEPGPSGTEVDSAVEVGAGVSEEALISQLRQMPGVREVVRIGPGLLSVSADRPLDDLAAVPGVVASTADLLLGYAGNAEPGAAIPLRASSDRPANNPVPTLTSGASATVAIIDAGFTLDNPELAARWWSNIDEDCFNGTDDDRNGFVDDCRGWDFGRNDADVSPERSLPGLDHGDEVAGVIAASRDGYGIVGVAPEATLMPLKVSRSNGTVAMSGVAAAIRYAVANKADIINISLITQSGVSRSNVRVLENAIAIAEAAGVMVVTGAGNDGWNLSLRPAWPASFSTIYDNVVTVGSGLGGNRRAPFSNTGSVVTVFAPGVSVPTVTASGDIVLRSGTSYAAPAVAGMLAIALQSDRNASLSELHQVLVDASVAIEGTRHLLTSTTRDLPTGSINLAGPLPRNDG